MLRLLLFLQLILYSWQTSNNGKENVSTDSGSDLGEALVSTLTNERDLDLSSDAEYEDLRAELLAYSSALKSISSSRRSLISTPCWTLGGICVNYKLCTGFKFLTEVPGCKDKLNVCCFAWNRYRVRDMRKEGIDVLAFPWNLHQDFGGKGVMEHDKGKPLKKRKLKRKPKRHDNQTETLALVIRRL